MSKHEPSPSIRYTIATWPNDAPRGAIKIFCLTHGISRSWFNKIRKLSIEHGQIRALNTLSTTPKTSPNRTSQLMRELLISTRKDLKEQGWDYGPLSVMHLLTREGFSPPSRSVIAKIFTQEHLVISSPKKRPRSSYQRFVYPAPNACWQIDATQWVLATGEKVAIFQLLDDHSRLALAFLVSQGESTCGALKVVNIALERHGVPQKFLSDNGAALNPSRRGRRGVLVEYLQGLGVQMITGRPGKPTTQGKNERFHQTLHQFLRARPGSASIEALQMLVDEHDDYYNHHRVHQGLAQITPVEAWAATTVADPPSGPFAAHQKYRCEVGTQFSVVRTINVSGDIRVLGSRFQIGRSLAGAKVRVLYDEFVLSVFDDQGLEVLNVAVPPAGSYIARGKAGGTDG